MATLGPDSYAIQPSETPLSQGPGTNPNINTSPISGGGRAGVTVDSVGAMRSIESSMSAMDSIAEFSKGIIDPKVQKMQEDLLWKGIQRAADGESMEDIRDGETWVTKLLHNNFMAKGAAVYKSNAAISDLIAGYSDDEEIAAMNPDEFRSRWVNDVTALKVGDSYVDSMIENMAVQMAPQVFRDQGVKFSAKVKGDLERERFNSNAADVRQMKKNALDLTRGVISYEEFGSRNSLLANNILTKGDDETDEAYSRRIVNVSEHAASEGNLSMLSVLESSGAMDALPPQVQSGFRGTVDRAWSIAVNDIKRENPEEFQRLTLAYEMATTEEEKDRALIMLDEWIKVSSGIMPGTLQHLTAVDRSKSLVTNSIQFKKQQAEEIKRRNKFHVMAYMRSQESLAEAHAESGDNESAMRIATSAIEYGYENGLNTSDISPGMWNFSGLRRTANKAILDRLKRVQEVASKEQDIIAKEAQEREDVNGLVSQILSQNPSLDGRYDELSSTQKNSAVNRVIAMSMYGEAAQDEYLSKKGIKDLKEGRLLIDFDRTANSLITMLGYGYDDQGRNTSHRIATGQEQNILQFRRAFESNNMDPSAVAVSLSLFNALEDKDMGNLVQSEIFGADGVEKIRRYNTALSLPSNEGREREIFMETFGFSSVPNFPISRDHLEWGERKASDEANGLFKAWPGGEVPTEKEDQEFIAQIYAQSLATAEALSGFSTDKRRIEVQAEALARRRYTNINGGIILYHNELGGITHDEILKESGVHMHVESPIGREFQYAALNSLIDERVLDLEPSRFSGWDYANMALNPFAWGLRAEAVKHGLSVRRTHDLVSNQDGTYSILSVTMIDDGQGGDVPITVHIGMDEYIQKIEDLQREYDSDRRRTNQGGEFKSAPAFQRKL